MTMLLILRIIQMTLLLFIKEWAIQVLLAEGIVYFLCSLAQKNKMHVGFLTYNHNYEIVEFRGLRKQDITLIQI